MNEGFSLFLNLEEDKMEENEILIQKIDDFLLNFGIKYSGLANFYVPTDDDNRDDAVFAACEALKNIVWLKELYAFVLVGNRTNVCGMEEILTDDMSEPSEEKLKYYEDYYLASGKLAHGIVVDENRQLRDGYISYILAKKYGIRTDIYEALSSQPLKKVVKGRHVKLCGNEWKVISENRYRWFYGLKAPVVPGDILQVKTRKGLAFIRVDCIEYETGNNFCRRHKKTKRHLRVRMKNS